MKKIFLFTAPAALLLAACGQQQQPQETSEAISIYTVEPGDSTRYGLACEGCTDSILVLLPYEGGDPDTLDIAQAFIDHRIYGRPHTGDKMAVIMSPDSTGEVLTAVNISTLNGEWSYQVTPVLSPHHPNMPPLPDSIRQRIMAPRTYSLVLKNGGMAFSKGAYRQNSDKMSPVKYPELRRYARWHLYNGKLVLLGDSSSRQQPDTATILLLRRDSLVLRFSNHEQEYHKK